MSDHISKSHNKSLLLYHLVCPIKYRRIVLSDEVSKTLKGVCPGISLRYDIYFIEIGCDDNHVHFLIQSVPMMSPKKIVNAVKSLTARKFSEYTQKLKVFCGVVSFGHLDIISTQLGNMQMKK